MLPIHPTAMLREGDELRTLAATKPLRVPTLAVGGFGGRFTEQTLRQISAAAARSVLLDGVGHHVALEAPERLAAALLTFIADIEA